MKRNTRFTSMTFVLVLAVLLSMSGSVGAAPDLMGSGAPSVVSYQGQVTVDGIAYTGAGYFKFAVVNIAGDTNYWFNDGSPLGNGAPTNAVTLTVSSGLFNVLLGDTTQTNMTALPTSAFGDPDRALRVWFSRDGAAFTLLSPDRRIAAVPYSLQAEKAENADKLDGQHASAFATSAHTHAGENITSGTVAEVRIHADIARDSEIMPTVLANDGAASTLDADLLDGQHASAFAAGTHTHAGGDITSGTVAEARIHAAIARDSEIMSTVLTNDGTGSGLDADLLDGLHASTFQRHYANVIVVAKSGGDYTTITAALNSITTASDTNRYLIQVMPGIYTERVTMKQYVDIEGAGELTTKITFTGGSTQNSGAATLVGAGEAELRFLKVENTGGNAYAIAIYNSSAAPRLTHITAIASGGTADNIGVYNDNSSPRMTNVLAGASGGTNTYGVYNDNSSPRMTNVVANASEGTGNYGVANIASTLTMDNVTATASGGTNNYGVSNAGSAVTMNNVTINASGGTSNCGVLNIGSASRINNSRITGSTATIYNDLGSNARVGASKLDGGGMGIGGGVTCAGVYDEDYTFYPSTCPIGG
jgi:hypothetical protein